MPNCGTRSEFTIATIRSTRDSYRISNEVVNEPGKTKSSKSDPVPFDYEPVWDLCTFHGIFLEPSRIFHSQSP